MAHYNPDLAMNEYSATEEIRSFKGVSIDDRSKVADIDVEESAIMGMHDEVLSNGNVVYVEGAKDGSNPFVYSSCIKRQHRPSQKHGSVLISASSSHRIEFNNQRGWEHSVSFQEEIITVYPIADEYVLEHLGEEQELLIHEI
jgi:hypothetical protein